jgi:hypothetical protein
MDTDRHDRDANVDFCTDDQELLETISRDVVPIVRAGLFVLDNQVEPFVELDSRQGPDVHDLGRVHISERSEGDFEYTWRVGISPSLFLLRLELRVVRPIRCSFALLFDVQRDHELLSVLADSHTLFVQPDHVQRLDSASDYGVAYILGTDPVTVILLMARRSGHGVESEEDRGEHRHRLAPADVMVRPSHTERALTLAANARASICFANAGLVVNRTCVGIPVASRRTVSSVLSGQIERAVDEGHAMAGGVAEDRPDLAVGRAPGHSAVLGRDAAGCVTSLGKTTLVDDQCAALRVAQMLDDLHPEVVAHRLGIPDRGVEQP